MFPPSLSRRELCTYVCSVQMTRMWRPEVDVRGSFQWLFSIWDRGSHLWSSSRNPPISLALGLPSFLLRCWGFELRSLYLYRKQLINWAVLSAWVFLKILLLLFCVFAITHELWNQHDSVYREVGRHSVRDCLCQKAVWGVSPWLSESFDSERVACFFCLLMYLISHNSFGFHKHSWVLCIFKAIVNGDVFMNLICGELIEVM